MRANLHFAGTEYEDLAWFSRVGRVDGSRAPAYCDYDGSTCCGTDNATRVIAVSELWPLGLSRGHGRADSIMNGGCLIEESGETR